MRLKPLYRQILCYETLKVRMAEFSFLPADKGNEMLCAEPNVHYLPESRYVVLQSDNCSNLQNGYEKQHLPAAQNPVKKFTIRMKGCFYPLARNNQFP